MLNYQEEKGHIIFLAIVYLFTCVNPAEIANFAWKTVNQGLVRKRERKLLLYIKESFSPT